VSQFSGQHIISGRKRMSVAVKIQIVREKPNKDLNILKKSYSKFGMRYYMTAVSMKSDRRNGTTPFSSLLIIII
ncbi:MAG: hypothetical protein K2G13_03360, partial [Muribaculaceae bacterium]|nr:hypothetical protein [Muribaculaceae bacterium]